MDRRLEAEEVVERLRELISSGYGAQFLEHLWGDPTFVRWKHDAERAIARIYGDSSSSLGDFREILSKKPLPTTGLRPVQEYYTRAVQQALAILESIQADAEKELAAKQRLQTLPKASTQTDGGHNTSNRIFVVHGRDDGRKEQVARFLEKLDLEAVILHEKPNSGQTVIEKFEKHSDVGFAVILLTTDDMGRLAEKGEVEKPRARQNVIFEFGYFIGRIRRCRVCALSDKEIEIPSDIAGFISAPFDAADAWKMQLVKELKAAGYNVDANKALQP